MMKRKLAILAISMTAAQMSFAGGFLTNTNQNVAFDRQLSRDAAIGIDGVYSNPAGVVFLGQGAHLSLNWQTAIQTRTINNEYPLFNNNATNASPYRTFEGKAFAPVIPSIQFAYNYKKFSFQANFAIAGGGGKAEFKNGLGSFEKLVAETAYASSKLAQVLDAHLPLGQKVFSSDERLGSTGKYSYDSYMRGRQYYYGLSLGAAYKVNDNLGVYAGLRGVYAMCNYYGYVKDITVGHMPLYTMLDPTKPGAADIELSSDQSGIGFTPIIGIDYKTGRWNFAAKYEFKTRMRLKNSSVNKAPSIGNLPANIAASLTKAGVPAPMTKALLSAPEVAGTMTAIKNKFDKSLNSSLGEYEDGKSIAADIPALLTLGVGYKPIDQLRLNAGFHYFWDKQATAYEHREKLLKRGTMEFNAGAEYDACKLVTVSAGWQNTSYGLTPEYMNDRSFVVSSNSVGAGVCLHLNKKMDLNLAYFCTLYGHMKTETGAPAPQYKSDYTRTNHVIGAGLDINF